MAKKYLSLERLTEYDALIKEYAEGLLEEHTKTHAPSNAEKNQNAFSNVVVGSTTIAANNVTDTLTLVAGNNITLTPDATNDKITIAASNYTLPEAGTSLGGVKSGGSVTISDGIITIKDDSHNHVISNIDNLQTTLDGKVPTTRTINGKTLSSNIILSASDVGADASGAANTAETNAKTYAKGLVDAIIGEGASTTLDTIGEISAAIEAHQDVTDALNAAIGNKANSSDLTSHINNKSNPHSVTKEQVGLGNVENKSSATIRGELTKANVTTALGYTPPTADTNTTYDLSASASSANGNVKLNLVAGGSGSGTDSVSIKGSGATTVTTDANGVITISSTDNDTIYTHPNSGVTAGTYRKVTVNAQGHVTAGENPTTLAGYGITDAVTASQLSTLAGSVTANANAITALTTVIEGIQEITSDEIRALFA